jgi:protein-S-isoprenylcysteine O-methyltransferase Ste14
MSEASTSAPSHTCRATAAVLAAYGSGSYVIFLAVFLYSVGFVGNWLVPKSIDSGPTVEVSESLTVNLLLLAAFALQHSLMARPRFKKWWTRIVPQPIERSTYVLVSSLLLALMFWQWQPIPAIVWEFQNQFLVGLMWALFAIGWLIVLISTILIDHFELFGLRQSWSGFLGLSSPSATLRQPLLYRVVRHPIIVGFIIAFWATPVMSWGHLLFAGMTTAYILVALQLEERDLRAVFGTDYERYQNSVPMIVPWPRV